MNDCLVQTIMKTSKSPEKTEVTPSKKILKQARLPFKLISEVPTSPITPQTRKRKLSAAETETAPKIGRLSKENDLAENAVVISDEESVDTDKSSKEEKPVNPFVKLVDTAWKKKLQKSKKKRTLKKSAKDVVNDTTDTVTTENHSDNNKDEMEKMDVDIQEDKVKDFSENSTTKSNSDVELKSPKSRKATPKKKVVRKARSSVKKATRSNTSDLHEVVVLEDSNPSDNLVETKDKPCVDLKTVNVGKEDCDKAEDTNREENNTVISPEKEKNDKNNSSSSPMSLKAKESSPADEKVESSPITPKRSARNKAKTEQKEKNLEKSISLDESICSNPSTPKQNRSSSVTTSLDESLNTSTTSANLTPKQVGFIIISLYFRILI